MGDQNQNSCIQTWIQNILTDSSLSDIGSQVKIVNQIFSGDQDQSDIIGDQSDIMQSQNQSQNESSKSAQANQKNQSEPFHPNQANKQKETNAQISTNQNGQNFPVIKKDDTAFYPIQKIARSLLKQMLKTKGLFQIHKSGFEKIKGQKSSNLFQCTKIAQQAGFLQQYINQLEQRSQNKINQIKHKKINKTGKRIWPSLRIQTIQMELIFIMRTLNFQTCDDWIKSYKNLWTKYQAK